LKLSVVVPADVRQAKDSRQNEGVDVAAETKAFILKEQSTRFLLKLFFSIGFLDDPVSLSDNSCFHVPFP
jgi:hypothetical protein